MKTLISKKLKWYRSDDVQFRMVFTPYTQESYLNELNGRKDIPVVLNWMKYATFMSNSFDTVAFPHLLDRRIYDVLSNFSTNVTMNIEQFKQALFNAIKNYFFDIYSSMNYMYLTTIMSSEDHSGIIKAVEKQKTKVNKNNQLFFAHNILREYLGVNIIKRDTACFDTLNGTEVILEQKNGENVYLSSFSGLSYDMVSKTIFIPTYCYQAGRTVEVPVNYIDYIPHTANARTACATLNHNDLFFYTLFNYGLQSNIQNDKILPLLNELKEKYRLCLRDGMLSLFIPEEVYPDFAKNDQAKLIEVAKLLNSYKEN